VIIDYRSQSAQANTDESLQIGTAH